MYYKMKLRAMLIQCKVPFKSGKNNRCNLRSVDHFILFFTANMAF